MTDIRLDCTFKTHRKRKALGRLLGPKGVLALLDLWMSTADQHPDGILRAYSPQEVADDAGWTGDPDRLVNAMKTAGFLEALGNGSGFALHNWEKRQPWLCGASERKEHASKAARMRWACSEHAEGNAPLCPSPLPSSPLPSQPPEKKSVQVGDQPKRKPHKLLLADDAEWLANLRTEYAKLGVDVDRETIKAKAFLTTPKGDGRQFTRRFFVGWLNKADRYVTPGNGVNTTRHAPPFPRQEPTA